MIYDFHFQGNWAEVKASQPTPFAFKQDLFLEEPLAERFKIPESELGTRAALALEGDSPYADADELRHLESLGFNQYFAVTQKQEFTAPGDGQPAGCADFRAAFFMLKNPSGVPMEQLVATLKDKKTEAGKSYFDIIREATEKYSTFQGVATLAEMNKFLHLPGIPDLTRDYEVIKAVGTYATKVIKTEIGAKFFEFLEEYDAIIAVPFYMWLDMIKEQAELSERAIAFGRVIAIRTWLARLIDLTYQREGDFPDDVTFDLTVVPPAHLPASPLPYYLQAWANEQYFEGSANPSNQDMVTAEEKLKEGFDTGAEMMNNLWPTILRYARQAMSDVLRAEGMDSCRVQALMDAGFPGLSKLEAAVVREFAVRLRNEMPHV
jgi:hypothetical protein